MQCRPAFPVAGRSNLPYGRPGKPHFLGGTTGWVIGPGTQHDPTVPRTPEGVPRGGAGTLSVRGDLKKMSPKWVRGVSVLGYGVSLSVGIGLPIPVLDEAVVAAASVGNANIFAGVIDYGHDYPNKIDNLVGEVSYAELKSGQVQLNGKTIPSAPMSSYPAAREIAGQLKDWITAGRFFLGEPQDRLPYPE